MLLFLPSLEVLWLGFWSFEAQAPFQLLLMQHIVELDYWKPPEPLAFPDAKLGRTLLLLLLGANGWAEDGESIFCGRWGKWRTQNPSWLTILRCGYVCSVGFHIRINAVFGHVDLLDAFLYIGLEILLCCVYKSLLFGKAWLVKWWRKLYRHDKSIKH